MGDDEHGHHHMNQPDPARLPPTIATTLAARDAEIVRLKAEIEELGESLEVYRAYLPHSKTEQVTLDPEQVREQGIENPNMPDGSHRMTVRTPLPKVMWIRGEEPDA